MAPGARPPCAACQCLHRSCVEGCIFEPYFPRGDDPNRFAAVHKVYRARRVADLLRGLPVERRQDAVNSLVNRAMALPRPWQAASAQELRAALAAARGQAMLPPRAAAAALRRLHKEASPSPPEAPSSSSEERPPCAACTRFHRTCPVNCVFAPLFPADDGPERFAAVHAVFGAGYVSYLLSIVPVNRRGRVVIATVNEALARRRELASAIPIPNVRVEQVAAELAAKLEELTGYTSQETAAVYAAAWPDPERTPSRFATMRQWNAAVDVAMAETMPQATAGAHAAGTSSSVAPPLRQRQKLVQRLAQQIAQAEQLGRKQAKQLVAFLKAAAAARRCSDEAPAAISPRESAEAAPSLIQQRPPLPAEQAVRQQTTATWQAVAVAHAGPGGAGSSSGATVASAQQYPDLELAGRLVLAWMLTVVEEVEREQDMTTPPAAADTHAMPGNSSAVTVVILPPESAEAAPSLSEQQQPPVAQMAVATIGVRDPDLPEADDQGGHPSQGSS